MPTTADAKTWKNVTAERVEEALGRPISDYAQQCHAASLHVVKSDLFEQSRVARGSCHGVGGQHSWVVVGDDCYANDALLLDVTLWSYDKDAPLVWKGRPGRHRPKGYGVIWNYGCPPSRGMKEVELAWPAPPSEQALDFLQLCRSGVGTLDQAFWIGLSAGPMQGWPAAEILAAIENTPDLEGLAPLDHVGMLTNLNPDGLYLRSNS